MASYRNPYNEAIANKQRRFDYANMANDYTQSLQQPLNGGAMLEGGDFWSDFADGFMSVWNPIIDTAGKVAPFLPLLGLGEEGVGLTHSEMSGGDMSVNAPYEGYVYGAGMSGGDDRNEGLVNQPFLGYGVSGGAIANDGQPPFNMITNAGMSGGRARDNPKWIVKQNDYCCIKDLKKPMACNGDPLPKAFMNDYRKKSNNFEKYREGKLAGYKGQGMSGGDEVSDTDHPIIRNPELQATAFLGGRKPSSVSKKEKIGMVQQVIADMLLKNKMKGKGLSGGDFWSDLGDTFSKVAPFLPLLGLGESGGMYDKAKYGEIGLAGMGVSGGDGWSDLAGYLMGPSSPLLGMGASGGAKLNHKALLEKKFADNLFKRQLKNLHGKGMSGGDFDWSSLLSFAPLLLGLGMSGGQVDLSELSDLEPFVMGMGMSGGDFWDDLGKGFSDAWSWITDTAIPAITPVIDTAGKIADVAGKFSGNSGKKEGKGYSGGAMTYEQNMNMADAMGDIFSGMGVSGGSRASDTRMLSGARQLYKGGEMDRAVGSGVSGGKKRQSRQSKMNERLAMKIAHLQGKGMEPTADMEASNKIVGLMSKANPAVDYKMGLLTQPPKLDAIEPPVPNGSGVSGGKKTSKWIQHVKAYAKTHGIKYGEALSKAKSTYRG